MSVNISSIPPSWTFAGNRNVVRLHCNDFTTAGSVCSYVITLSSLPPLGHFITVTVDGLTLRFEVGLVSSSDSYNVTSASELYSKLSANYHLAGLFNWSFTSGRTSAISLAGAQAGRHVVAVGCETADGMPYSQSAASAIISLSTANPGDDPGRLPNYNAVLQLQVRANNNNSITTANTPLIYLTPDNDGYCQFPLDILNCYFPQPDMPRLADTAAQWFMLTNAFISYRVGYGESYGDTPLVQGISWSGWQYALRGELQDYYHRLGLPDWQDIFPSVKFTAMATPALRIIGQQNNARHDIHADQPEYLYGLLLHTGSAAASFSLRIAGDISGTRTTTLPNLQNGNIFCIPVGPSQVGCAADNYYTLTILYGTTAQFRATYLVHPPARDPHIFLLQNKYGLMVTLYASHLQQKQHAETETLTIQNRRYRTLDDRWQIFTATSAPLRADEARLLQSCFVTEFHYCYAAGAWQRIILEGGDIMYADDSEDMMTIEFSFRFCENQAANIADSTIRSDSNTQVVETNTVDEGGHYVSFNVRTNRTSNALYN